MTDDHANLPTRNISMNIVFKVCKSPSSSSRKHVENNRGAGTLVLDRTGDGSRPPGDDRLAATVAADGASLQRLELHLEGLDLGVGLFEILVETVALGNKLLLPLPEALLLDLDLFCEALAESLLLLLELGVVELPWAGLAELASLHLLGAVSLVVQLLCCVDKVQHVGADKNRAEFLEVAVFLILDLGNTPRILATLDNTSIAGLNILLGTDNSKGHGGHQAAGVLRSSLVILLDRWLVDLDTLSFDDGTDLETTVSDKLGTRVRTNSKHSPWT